MHCIKKKKKEQRAGIKSNIKQCQSPCDILYWARLIRCRVSVSLFYSFFLFVCLLRICNMNLLLAVIRDSINCVCIWCIYTYRHTDITRIIFMQFIECGGPSFNGCNTHNLDRELNCHSLKEYWCILRIFFFMIDDKSAANTSKIKTIYCQEAYERTNERTYEEKICAHETKSVYCIVFAALRVITSFFYLTFFLHSIYLHSKM